MKISEHLEKLGLEGTDRITGAKGVITSISFDLFGCIQAVLTPKLQKEGKRIQGYWYDINRLKISKKRVMELPDFTKPKIAAGLKGPAEKPPQH